MKVLNFDKPEDLIQTIHIKFADGSDDIFKCEYYGSIQGIDSMIAFWKPNDEIPFKMVNVNQIILIERLDNDTSKLN